MLLLTDIKKSLIMRTLILFTVLVVMASCATPYQQKAFSGGYSDVKLNDNIFNVTFKGNSSTSLERAVDFSMLRSAEITLENGYKYFSVIDSEKYAKEYIHFDRKYWRYYKRKNQGYFFKLSALILNLIIDILML